MLLGFKRQTILLRDQFGNTDPVVISVANAPGLPPVVGVTLVSGDGDASTLARPEGFEIIEVSDALCRL